ncbi:coproporphyrinogen III oxidase [Pasteurellaceae bacterium RH1A]|nr:coproporphyrinogen III oxidase [Pasteurellaceae bacterium RH1A]
MKFFLIILALLIILSLAGYVVYLLLKLAKQKRLNQAAIEQAQKARFLKIIDSIEVIARAMQSEQCDFSEGVLRLKALLDVLGLKLATYPAMFALYEVVADHPILDERKNLARNQRMKLDLEREAAEAEHQEAIKKELPQLLNDIEQFKKDI